LQADANELETAILNLALNARDAMTTGGKTVRHAVMLAVSDCGGGVAQETIQQAFEPFFTTKQHGAGAGLGLSQVHGFTKQSGGHVKVYSQVGEGTTVKIYLPRFTHDEAIQTVERGAPETSVQGTETILVVEDEEDVRTFVTTILREGGSVCLRPLMRTRRSSNCGRIPQWLCC
jgi:Histidine kinase-, DNA gyrase B-, and HSP90-like ATPase